MTMPHSLNFEQLRVLYFMLFAHITDVHLPTTPVKPHELFSKRVLSYLSWHLKRKKHHLKPVSDALVEDMQSFKPEHICVTGDVTNLGLKGELEQARDWLQALAPANKVSFVPGNHDTLTPWSVRQRDKYFSPWMQSDDGKAEMPYVQVRGKVAFIGVDTGVATLPFMATGTVGAKQMARLEQVLNKTKEQGLYRVVLIHHPPLPNINKARKALTDAEALAQVIDRTQPELILHGHNHVPMEYGRGETQIFGTGSASVDFGDGIAVAHYSLFEVKPSGELKVTHRYYNPETRKFATR